MAEQIIIDIENHVNVKGGMDPVQMSAEKAAKGSDSGEFSQTIGTINAMQLVKAFEKIGIAVSKNSPEIRQMMDKISKSIKYASMATQAIMRAAAGDYTALIMLAVEIALQAIGKAQEAAAKSAQQANTSDLTAIQAGVLDIENANITANWWSGRYQYSGR